MEWLNKNWKRLVVIMETEQILLLEKMNRTADVGGIDWKEMVRDMNPAHA